MKKLILLLLIALLVSCKSAQNNGFKFEKIAFHSSMCFGFCPSYHMEVRSDKTVLLQGDSIRMKRMANVDNSKVGYFTGKVDDALYEKMIRELQTIGLDTVKFNGPMCCDGSVKTLIVYYNGKRKYLRAMFPPDYAHDLMSTMSDIYSKSQFTPTDQKFVIEFDSIRR